MAEGELEAWLATEVQRLEWAALPDAVRETARRAVFDFSGCLWAGGASAPTRTLVEVGQAQALPGSAHAVGGAAMAAPLAAWANAVAGHVLDFDDNHDGIGGHPSAVLLPALLATAEEEGVGDLQAILSAYVAGVEAMQAIATALGRGHYERGFHPTATTGALAGALACARLRRASTAQMVGALGLAAGMAGGVKANFGSAGKAIQVGHAAAVAVMASRLAERGVMGAAYALSGAQGVVAVMGAAAPGALALPKGFAPPFALEQPGLVFKLYPCCASTHAALDAVLAVRGRWQAAGPVRIRVHIPAGRRAHIDRPAVADGLSAKFSLQYVLARAWLDGAVTVADFREARVGESAVQALMGAVEVIGEPVPWPWTQARVTVIASGQVETEQVPVARGHGAARPLDRRDLMAKAQACGVDPIWAERLWQVLHRDAASVGELVALWSAVPTPS